MYKDLLRKGNKSNSKMIKSYKLYRNWLNRVIYSAKQSYYNKILIQNKNASAKIWKTITLLYNSKKKKSHNFPTSLQTSDGIVHSHQLLLKP